MAALGVTAEPVLLALMRTPPPLELQVLIILRGLIPKVRSSVVKALLVAGEVP
jgi:hypothetical protein